MRKYLLAIDLMLLGIISCQQVDARKPIKISRIINTKPPIKHIPVTDSIINTEFVNRVMDSDLVIPRNTVLYQPLVQQRETQKNIHDPNITDTIVSLKKDNDSYRFLKTSNKSILTDATIVTNKMVLDSNITIGTSKEIFQRKFQFDKGA